MMDIVAYNRTAWANEVKKENIWTQPVDTKTIQRAKNGDYELVLTPKKPVPKDWIGDVLGKKVLCLACGGGQQGPVFAALGAAVTVFDNCPEQLEKDAEVAKREGLCIELVQGDMRDLSCFADKSFDLIFHPVSNCFAPSIGQVWKECHRVLKGGGALLAGFINPVMFIFDMDEWDEGRLAVRYSIPYADTEQLPKERLQEVIDGGEPLEFGHSLQDQIGGQIDAGFLIAGFYDDNGNNLLDDYIPSFVCTRAIKAGAD
jgi:SAM-dependent methyltransferase